MYKKLVFIALMFFVPMAIIWAQDTQSRERGEVKDAEFIIRKDRVLTLPKQPRVFERTPTLPSTQSKGSYTYEVKNFFLNLKPTVTDTQPFQKTFPRDRGMLYHSYVKAGYGNYQSPLGELYINNVESDFLNYGVFLKHQGFYEGPVDGKNSAEDHTNIRLDASYFQDDIEFFGKLGYDRDKHHFYGYTPGMEVARDTLGQIFNTIYGNVGLRRIDRNALLYYEASLGLRLFNDNYFAREHEVGLHARLGITANDERWRGGLDLQGFITSPSDTTYSGINRNYAKINPYIQFANDQFKIRVGANLIVENDSSSTFHIFPNVAASYYLTESFGLYAEFEGDVVRKTYYDFAMENPFLGPSATLRNTIQNYKIDVGVKGAINDELSYKTGIRYGEYENMHFYGNHMADSARFQLIYDRGTKILNYHISVGWKYEDWYKLQASGDYYHYELTDISSPWHRPEWELSVQNYIMPNEKWFITANLNVLGGIQALNLQAAESTTLNPIIDFGAKVDYAVTPRFSVFVEGNNLLNQKNERYWNYRARGIQGIGGLTFKF
ncbi:MAG TPA: TonB-dependent receptor [Cyclobacteriaceae bacterium]|nr:TonB-dependent receptor [Cyclobacteriaceae bacterium]